VKHNPLVLICETPVNFGVKDFDFDLAA